MTTEEAKHKLDFMKKAYQKLIDEKVDSGKLVGDGVRGEWKAEAPLDEAYKDMIGALDMAIKALEQQPKTGHWITTGHYFTGAYECIDYVECSCCHEESLEEGDYCPNCGTRMEV